MSATFVRSSAELRQHVARLLVVFLLVFYGWAACANVLSASHDPVAVSHAHPVAGDANGDHGHSDDSPAAEGTDASAHQHDHDAADHSHEKQNLTRHAARLELAGAQHWGPAPLGVPPSAPVFAFERPPRSVPSV